MLRSAMITAPREGDTAQADLTADLDRLDRDGPVASHRLRFDWLPAVPDALPEEDADAAMEAAMQWAQQVMPPHVEGGDDV